MHPHYALCKTTAMHRDCAEVVAAASAQETLVWGAGEAVGAPARDLRALRAQRSQLHSYGQLKRLHWDPQTQTFLDWGSHTEDVALARPQPGQVRAPQRRCAAPPQLLRLFYITW